MNTAKAATNISGNGITAGQSLTNYWMVGRWVLDVTQADVNTPVSGPLTMTIQFAVAGKNNGTTTFTGATQAAGRFNTTLNFAVPAPGAAALVGLAGMVTRRRRARVELNLFKPWVALNGPPRDSSNPSSGERRRTPCPNPNIDPGHAS